jgi:chemotaxis protein MotB
MAQDNLMRLQTDSSKTHEKLDECGSSLSTCNVNLGNCNTAKSALERQNNSLTGKVQSTEKDLKDYTNKSEMTIADQAKRLKDLQDLIQSQRNVMNKLKKTIADALVNFKADELSVYVKDGKVYVSLEEKLLFKSGSAVVDPKGKEAIGKLAQVLNSTADISVLIEGHTDTIPIKTEKFADNWALSTGRAASIVRILTKDYGVDPHRVTASGRGEFQPVKPNDTPEGRASNRRTEIIISPNLSELYKLLGD